MAGNTKSSVKKELTPDDYHKAIMTVGKMAISLRDIDLEQCHEASIKIKDPMLDRVVMFESMFRAAIMLRNSIKNLDKIGSLSKQDQSIKNPGQKQDDKA